MARWLALAVFLAPAVASAQAGGADVVRLVDGGIVRGTIVEHLPGDHTTVLLVTGETRTLPAARIERVDLGVGPRETAAGLATPRRSAPPTPIAAAEPTVHVRVRTTGRRDLAIHTVEGTSTVSMRTEYLDPLCEIPCELDLEPGLYVFGISRTEGAIRRPDHSRFALYEDTDLRVDFRSHSALRVGGWIMFVAGGLTGSLLVGMSALLGFFGVGLGLLVPGSILIVFSLVHFLVNAFRNDHVDIRSEPLTVRF